MFLTQVFKLQPTRGLRSRSGDPIAARLLLGNLRVASPDFATTKDRRRTQIAFCAQSPKSWTGKPHFNAYAPIRRFYEAHGLRLERMESHPAHGQPTAIYRTYCVR